MFNKLLMILLFLGSGFCLKLIPERAVLTYTNDSFVSDVLLNVRKSRRGGDYIVNLHFTTKHQWGNNVTLDIFFYEYLHNEYRRTFVTLHYKFCDFILKDKIFGAVLRKIGITTCPIPAGFVKFHNAIFNEKIPSVWPFTKGKFELIASADPNKDVMGMGDLMFRMEDNIPLRT